MAIKVSSLAFVLLLCAITNRVEAQHCGGPCEVPRGADPVSSNPRYTLSMGIEKDDWRYLFNWYWTVDGEQKFRVESALKSLPARNFGFRRMFVSPSGNGFLVTGNSYAGKYLNGKEPPLFLFFAPEGKLLSERTLFQATEEDERKLGQCPHCKCHDVLYVFAEDPKLCEDGVFVELYPYQSIQNLYFFLPFGCAVSERIAFEEALEAAEWSRLSSDDATREKEAIQALIDDLNSEALKIRTASSTALLAKGYLARTAINKAYYDSESGNVRARAKSIQSRLRPLGGLPWEEMSNDLQLLSRMLSYAEPQVVEAVSQRLQKIVPPLKGLPADEQAAWITKHRANLHWNVDAGQYAE